MAQRVRLRRGKPPPGAVDVTRPPWASPYRAGEPPPRWPRGKPFTDQDAAEAYRLMLAVGHLARLPPGYAVVRRAVVELPGRDLACTCRLSEACHADVLLEYGSLSEVGTAG